ncbi:uncharacterized protein LAESUDRAFT_443524 [Laetiporus sulphureus 93-53]|uniref:Zn(2)-C6 fungal-type domain-containing protein n=1 Tax=Laetiporus sulphureus 93-53 TaxID=1314785 RepID=A0A165C081_9APHY|nr:uncharacterized protein LAESUDRAFT_443524 [Laetiporus sulphureus 93-53]KZT01965.1 hypothetical protein LAESUDRAFT_443524 [Laetiporus sulphureus 93-53]
MPKAASSTFAHVHGTVSPQNAHVLRRNQACHQCRKRKLKCDAKRPCSTCIRSHAYAVAHAPPGAKMPPAPECTYDMVPDLPVLEQREPPKGRFERLESRINELEALLAERDKPVRTPELTMSSNSPISRAGSSASSVQLGGGSPASMNSYANIDPALSVADPALTLGFLSARSNNSLDSLADAAMLVDSDSVSATEPASRTHGFSQTNHASTCVLPSNSVLEVISLAWPRNLPSSDLLRHLVDAYFSFNPDANRLFHRPTFMASLSLPPTHPKFPLTALLHSMCALGSFYTAAVAPAPHPTSSPFPIDDPFDGKHKVSEQRPDSFAEIQARYARHAIDSSYELGEELFQVVQAEVLLSSWYWASAKWAEAYMSMCRALRSGTPIGLNVCSPVYTIADNLRPPSIIPPSKTVVEDETRRNTFWISYAQERAMSCGHGWALMLDDLDVSQMLPIRGEDFEQGIAISPKERQWSHDRDVLLNHPPEQTDAFVLYIKAHMLLSRVKNFNIRFRARYYAGDPSVTVHTTIGETDCMQPKDIRNTPAFFELNGLVTDFQNSFPTNLRHPVQNNLVNPHLFAAFTAPLLAHILLHETHAAVGSEACQSSLKILNAARGILNLVYDVCATSYDLSLLGQFAAVSWFMAGRVLVRFLRAAINSNTSDLSVNLLVEIDFIRMVLYQAGERLPIAYRYGKMLHDFIIKNCGEEYANPTPSVLPPRGAMVPATNGSWLSTSDLAMNLQMDSSVAS